MEIFLDSGAFSAKWAKNSKYKDENKKVLEGYMQFIDQHRPLIKYYANMDVIGDAKRTWENQRIMESNGFSPLPIFHWEDHPRPFLYRCFDNYPYFCMGGMARDSMAKRRPFMIKNWRLICGTKDKTPRCKVHGFGMTSTARILEFPWYSVDSTSWVMYGKYGIVLVPQKDPITNDYDYSTSPIKVIVSSRSPALDQPKRKHLHFFNFDDEKKERLLDYFEEKQAEMGESDWDDSGKEIIIRAGITNDHKLRDSLNLRYFLDLEANKKWPSPYTTSLVMMDYEDDEETVPPLKYTETKMQMYLAGNFPQMKNIDAERKAMKDVLKIHPVYRRLISYYYENDSLNVLNLKKEVMNGRKKKRIIRGAQSGRPSRR